MHENFISTINKRNESVNETDKLNSLINQMKLIDENVKDLFIKFDEDIINDHDAFLLFRGKVSKRLIDYTTLIARCEKIIGCNEIPQQIKDEYNYHLKNLENHKMELSLWWKKFEKKYHQLCLKIFLEQKEKLTEAGKDDDSDETASKMNLEDTKKMMMDEVNRMKNVKSELIESSDKLKKQDATFNSFETKIRSSAQMVVSLKRRAERDTKYVWFSFFFFLTVCVYIILRRLGFIRAILTITKLSISTLLYIIKYIFSSVAFFKKSISLKDNHVTEVETPIYGPLLNETASGNEL